MSAEKIIEIKRIEETKRGQYIGGCWTCESKEPVVTVKVIAASKNSITWPCCRKCLFRLNGATDDAIWELDD